MTILRNFSSYQLATFVGSLGLAVQNARKEKNELLSCAANIKNKCYSQVGSFLFFKATEKVVCLGIRYFKNSTDSLLPCFREKKTLCKKTLVAVAIHTGLCLWAVLEIYYNMKSFQSDAGELLLYSENSEKKPCIGYVLSSLLASIGKILIGCETLVSSYYFYKTKEMIEC